MRTRQQAPRRRSRGEPTPRAPWVPVAGTPASGVSGSLRHGRPARRALRHHVRHQRLLRRDRGPSDRRVRIDPGRTGVRPHRAGRPRLRHRGRRGMVGLAVGIRRGGASGFAILLFYWSLVGRPDERGRAGGGADLRDRAGGRRHRAGGSTVGRRDHRDHARPPRDRPDQSLSRPSPTPPESIHPPPASSCPRR